MEYISTKDTTKHVRKALKHYFPRVKFSVRSECYSGGSSIHVAWTDGPRTQVVERIAKAYEGADFDGMIDLKTNHSSVLVNESGPREVQFGADFVFCQRSISRQDDLQAQAAEIIRQRCKTQGAQPYDRFGDWAVLDLAKAMVFALDFEKGTTLQDAFREIVLREREEVAS